MRKTKKSYFPNLKSLLKKLKGGMSPVNWGQTYKQPSEAVMQHATTAGGKRRTHHKHRTHRKHSTRRKHRKHHNHCTHRKRN